MKLPKLPKIRISKKLSMALLVGNVAILNDYFGWGLDIEIVKQVITLACVYILGQGAVDIAGRFNGK